MTVPASSLQRLTALVIDDARVMRMLLRAWLGQLGVRVVEAESGEAALQIFRNGTRKGTSGGTFDLVFCDINLPGISGLAVVEAIRSGSHRPQVPIVMLTTLGRGTDVARGQKLGATHYLTKPLTFPALAETVHAIRRARPVAGVVDTADNVNEVDS